MLKKKCVAVCLLAAVTSIGLTGCFTMKNSDRGFTTSTPRENRLLLSDTVLALGKLDAAASKAIGQNDALVMIGKQKTYVFVKGGDKLAAITQAFATNAQLNAAQLSLTNHSKTLFLDEGTAWGNVEFTYVSTQTQADQTQTEAALLLAMGFKQKKDTAAYVISIPVEAAVKPAVDLSQVKLPTFQKNRELTFYEPNAKARTTRPNLGTIVLAPFALALDVVTSPLLLLGGVVGGLVVMTIIDVNN